MVPNTKQKPGFTLIEVLVAATIIALLTSIGVVSYQAAKTDAALFHCVAEPVDVRILPDEPAELVPS